MKFLIVSAALTELRRDRLLQCLRRRIWRTETLTSFSSPGVLLILVCVAEEIDIFSRGLDGFDPDLSVKSAAKQKAVRSMTGNLFLQSGVKAASGSL